MMVGLQQWLGFAVAVAVAAVVGPGAETAPGTCSCGGGINQNHIIIVLIPHTCFVE